MTARSADSIDQQAQEFRLMAQSAIEPYRRLWAYKADELEREAKRLREEASARK